ncbi:MAG: hypothetical protein ABSA70_09975 [Terriglobia bacterium]
MKWGKPQTRTKRESAPAGARSGDHVVWVSTAEGTSNSVYFYVQVPTTLGVVSVSTIATGSTGGCTSGEDYGIRVAIKYQVFDQSTQAITSSYMEPQEKILNYVLNGQNYGDLLPNWADIGPSQYPGTTKCTDGSGQFLDAPYGTCASFAFTNSFTQPISILAGTARYSVRTNNVAITSSSQGHGSVTNGSDIQKSR